MMSTRWVTRLMIANVLAYIVSLASPVITSMFMLVPAYILDRPWTIITYMFLHADIWHLFFNMLGLYFFGPRLELEIGERHFLWLYFLSGIAGAALSFIFSPFAAIIGASGAVYGILLGFAFFWPRAQIFIWGVFPVESRWLVVGMTVLSLFQGFGGSGDGVAHFAHLGGFAGGFLYLKWLQRRYPAGVRFSGEPVAEPSAPSTADLERWSKIQRERMHIVNREELDRILAKLAAAGPASLTPNEREFLDRFSMQ